MRIRLLQKKENIFFIQQSKTYFGKNFWISLRNRKKLIRSIIYYIIGNAIFPFLLYGVMRIFTSFDYIEKVMELYNVTYLYFSVMWAILFSLYESRITEHFLINDSHYHITTEINYNGKYIDIKHDDLVKSGKRTIFGKVKTVYYLNKKDLRREKLDRLKSLSSDDFKKL